AAPGHDDALLPRRPLERARPVFRPATPGAAPNREAQLPGAVRLRRGPMKCAAALAGLAILLAGCGSSGTSQLTIGAARTFRLAGFAPTRFAVGKPARLSFTIDQPSGKPLTSYRTGSGPHTGVHLIIVRSDLAVLIHKH